MGEFCRCHPVLAAAKADCHSVEDQCGGVHCTAELAAEAFSGGG